MEKISQKSPLQAMETRYHFDFKLQDGEAYEAFYHLADKHGKTVRMAAVAVITVLVAYLLYMQYRVPMALYYSVVALFGISLLFWLLYAPVLQARRGVKAIRRTGGTFAFTLRGEGFIVTDEMSATAPPILLVGDKGSRAVETKNLFVIRPNRQNSFCIPKRILADPEQSAIRRILQGYIKNYQVR